jgi:hypothetical protein
MSPESIRYLLLILFRVKCILFIELKLVALLAEGVGMSN